MPVSVQQPTWLSVGHELTLVRPLPALEQLAPFPAGTVMHSDMSEDAQLIVPPPPPPPEDDELQAVSLPVNASPTSPARRIPKS